MKLLLALSLDENEQDSTVTVVDRNGNEQVLHAAGGQCHVEISDGDTVTVGKAKARGRAKED